MIKRKKILLITTFIIIATLVIVLCVGLFNKGKNNKFEGTLVETNINESDL